MVYRKIIQLSPTTKVISLPSDWLKKNKVKKGDSVSVEEKNNKIIIEAEYSESPSCDADFTPLDDDMIWMAIDTLYILGYTHINLRLTSSQKRLMIKVIKFFPVFIIASESKGGMELQAVAKSLEIDFEKTLQRVRHLTVMMIDEGLSGNADIKKYDYTLNTHISMCFRYLSTNPNYAASNVAWAQFVKILEMFADRICILFAEAGNIDKKRKDMLLQVKRLYNESFSLMEKFSMEKISLHERERKKLESISNNSPVNLHVRELARALFDLEEVIFQLKMKR